MFIIVPNKNVEKNESFGDVINQFKKEYIDKELKKRQLNTFTAAIIEISKNKISPKIYLNNEVEFIIKFKKDKINKKDVGKNITIDLHDVEDIEWNKNVLAKKSAKIMIIRFNKSYWIYKADFKNNEKLKRKFKVTKKHSLRLGGYLPLKFRRQEKDEFMKTARENFEKELPKFWKRYLTTTQRYRGVMSYDGNYYDLFSHAQDLYILGHYLETIILCRLAAEQALISIIIKSGKAFEIYKNHKGKRKLKSIEELVNTCRSYKLFSKKFPITKLSAAKLNKISTIASKFVHPKFEFEKEDTYKQTALECMDYLQSVIKKHLNFIKDTKITKGYKMIGNSRRLK